jgi:tetratricopeptide (TPR) repeat protein
VEYTDGELGKFISFLKEKGLYDKSVIVVAADHGEGLDDHGEGGHGIFLYETTIHVPLIVRAPRPFARRVVTGTVELVDVAPTVLDLLDIPAPKQWQGRSLWPLLDGRKADDLEGQAYSETYYPRSHYGWSSLQVFTSGKLKYILAPRDELFDLNRDPQELRELAGDRRRLDLKKRMLAFVSRSSRGALKSASVQRMNADDQRRLASLGYLSGTVRVDESRPLADPKDKIVLCTSLARATRLFEEKLPEKAAAVLDPLINDTSGLADGQSLPGNVDMARRQPREALAAILERLTSAEPELADAWTLLGNVNMTRQRPQEALAAFRRALALNPDNNSLMLNIITSLLGAGEIETAAMENLRFLKSFPDDPTLLEQLGHIRLLQRRPDETLTLLNRAMALDPASSQLYNLAGMALILKGDHAAAEDVLRRGLHENPQAYNTHYLLAQVQEALQRPDAAIDLYRRELDINPEKFEAAVNLANLLKQRRRFAEAIRYYRMAIHANAELKMPRFHLAGIMLKENRDLDQAIALCLEGVDLPPRDQDTLFGYFMLTKLYEATGNPERRDYYFNLGAKLSAALGR